MSLGLFLSGLLLAGLLGLGRGSVRRYQVAAGLGLLVASAAFPLAEAVGYLSREALGPTLLALLPFAPYLALVPLGGVLALGLAPLGERAAGLGGAVGGGLGLLRDASPRRSARRGTGSSVRRPRATAPPPSCSSSAS